MNKKTEELFEGYKWVSKSAEQRKGSHRPILHSVFIDATNKGGFSCKRVAVGCDGYRMAIMPVENDLPLGPMHAYGNDGPPEALEGQYPAWDMILPKDLPYELGVNTKELVKALKAGRGMGEVVYLLFELNEKDPNKLNGEGTLYLYFPGESDSFAVAKIDARLSRGLALINIHGAIMGSPYQNARLNAVINTKYLLTALEGWKDMFTSIQLESRNKMVELSPGYEGLNKPLALVMLMCPNAPGFPGPKPFKVWQKIERIFT